MLNDQLLLHDCEFIIIIIDIGNMSFSLGFFFVFELNSIKFWFSMTRATSETHLPYSQYEIMIFLNTFPVNFQYDTDTDARNCI